ncbi:hypothetical protein FRX31_007865 [Thalictrum thalictroides]|uniref:Uncharacterized protein n=1 Tax=Thalictrum thalictroides TaxID=46969 RepID=A0A7J6X193_THATH|nr:hypothetical protein FRX31_007865 [Thalictrum thalictroides]
MRWKMKKLMQTPIPWYQEIGVEQKIARKRLKRKLVVSDDEQEDEVDIMALSDDISQEKNPTREFVWDSWGDEWETHDNDQRHVAREPNQHIRREMPIENPRPGKDLKQVRAFVTKEHPCRGLRERLKSKVIPRNEPRQQKQLNCAEESEGEQVPLGERQQQLLQGRFARQDTEWQVHKTATKEAQVRQQSRQVPTRQMPKKSVTRQIPSPGEGRDMPKHRPARGTHDPVNQKQLLREAAENTEEFGQLPRQQEKEKELRQKPRQERPRQMPRSEVSKQVPRPEVSKQVPRPEAKVSRHVPRPEAEVPRQLPRPEAEVSRQDGDQLTLGGWRKQLARARGDVQLERRVLPKELEWEQNVENEMLQQCLDEREKWQRENNQNIRRQQFDEVQITFGKDKITSPNIPEVNMRDLFEEKERRKKVADDYLNKFLDEKRWADSEIVNAIALELRVQRLSERLKWMHEIHDDLADEHEAKLRELKKLREEYDTLLECYKDLEETCANSSQTAIRAQPKRGGKK